MANSKIKQIGDQQRPNQTSRSIYNDKDNYNTSHQNALSDGDPKGRGENSGVIGTSIDIQQRTQQSAKNLFNPKKPYKLDD